MAYSFTGESFEEVCDRYRRMHQRLDEQNASPKERMEAINKFRAGY